MRPHRLPLSSPWILLSQMLWVVLGMQLVAGLGSIPSVGWMFMHHPDDFKSSSWMEIIQFLWGLRTGIPPMLAGFELICVKLTGSADWITVTLYQTALVTVYLLALLLARKNLGRYGLSLAVSTVFLYATVLIHPGVPASYDIFFACFFLLSVLCLQSAAKWPHTLGGSLWAVLAGFFLSATELSRPFVIYLIPVWLWIAWCMIHKRPAVVISFLLPVVLITGLWHVHLYHDFNQISFSNHAGINLSRGWPQIHYPTPLDEQSGVVVKPGRWFDRNTEIHTLNSRMMGSVVLKYWMEHPLASTWHMLVRLKSMLSAKTQLYSHQPRSWIFMLYAPTVWLTTVIALAGVYIRVKSGISNRESMDWLNNGADLLISVFTLCSLLIQAVGESGEEARLLLSVLPMLAVCPIPNPPTTINSVA